MIQFLICNETKFKRNLSSVIQLNLYAFVASLKKIYKKNENIFEKFVNHG